MSNKCYSNYLFAVLMAIFEAYYNNIKFNTIIHDEQGNS